ncbi:acyclic terpene utilization AtuA family protein [Flavilitoribacter nigricans]|uniref:ABC transporter substrate-binding protein n=1 Tax=Flavilitoribacter nigricans (strain ATCC 23147 / DSM 23189 / NBRC 102662 / NCIMB 1420 / SS-2) TaxID=1122177 RepID=A0A2D0NHA8_FLAN2|nr:acyclic terpene utilization AtuA family protein [Flavilitoribacter nigricans]PHN07871.1 ABC transporter substrate-binding protein [Flavilitoribacter nigricans DSM 23189 = NBRC 102662]
MNDSQDKIIRIGSGAGYSGDRIEPAVELAERGQLHYLAFECLAERTIALAQQRRQRDPQAGYDPLLDLRMRACLPPARRNGVRIISNMGAANPVAAMERTVAIARELGLQGLKIAAITGDDVLEQIQRRDFPILETGGRLEDLRPQIISANAYLGVTPIVAALAAGADVILTGRVADPALFLAPLIHEFGWSPEDYHLLGKGTVLGHLLECAGHVSGGYFADPGVKEVPDLARLGFPIAEVRADGDFILTKLPGTGGMITPATCKEQLLYEIHDPTEYLTPDVVADLSGVTFRETGKDRVEVTGGSGKVRTGLLKVSVGFRDGFIGEGQISYGGAGAVARGELALDIVRQRLDATGVGAQELRFDLMGVNSLYGNTLSVGEPAEVRVRVAGRTENRAEAVRIGNEVESLYTNGPAGGGGATKSVGEIIAINSILIDSSEVDPKVTYKTV